MTRPAYKIEQRDLAALKKNPKNAREHSPAQISTLRLSLREYGWTMPMLVDEADNVIAGHGRLEAGLAEGLAQGPVIVARGWTAKQKRAYALMDNKVALDSTWNLDQLRIELAELEGLKLDMNLTGFSLADLTTFGVPGHTLDETMAKAEETPSPSAKPIVKSGELWLLGGSVTCPSCKKTMPVESARKPMGKK